MERPHAVLISIPGQGHINPMLQLAKLLHSKGFYITFINNKFSHDNILNAQGPDALNDLPDFKYEVIPDGIILPDSRSQQKVASWCMSTFEIPCVGPFRDILVRLKKSPGVPQVSCVVYNWLMSFALDVADELGIPAFAFCTMSAVGFMGSFYLDQLVKEGYTPLKDESYLTNGHLDTTIDWIPGMKGMRLRDLSSFIRTTYSDDFFLKEEIATTMKCAKAKGLILNTFDDLESEVLNAIRNIIPKVYTLGPLDALANHVIERPCVSMKFNYWKHDNGYIDWLDAQKTGSVIYVSFGSLTTMSTEQLTEFAWGLANSKQPFLWIIRADLVAGEKYQLSQDFITEIEGRGFITNWCLQEKVLSHKSVGGFMTHSGWNSTRESIHAGVPMISWPGFAEQYTNCRYVCKEWEIGLELDKEVKREAVTRLVKELMEGENGRKLRKNALKLKEAAERATVLGGTSYKNIEKLAMDLS